MLKDGLLEIGGVVDGLVPRDLSDSSDLSVKEERPRMLRGVLGDLMREAGVVLDELKPRYVWSFCHKR